MVKSSPTQSLPSFKSFQEVAEAVPALVTVYNVLTGQYLYINPAIEKLLGYSQKHFLVRGVPVVTNLVHPDDVERVKAENIAALKKANQKNHGTDRDPIITFRYRIKHKNGTWRWLHCDGSVFSRNAKGQVECILNASLDITETKKAEEELRKLTEELEKRVQERTEKLAQSEERYQTFLSQSSEAIWRFELETPISTKLPIKKQLSLMFEHAYLAECNDALAKMYGLEKAEDLLGTRVGQFLVPTDPKNIAYLTAFIKSGYRLADAESHEKDALGRDRIFHNNLIGIIQDGKVLRAWGTQRDVTDMKKMEQRKDDFIALVSHELKTPITSLKLYTQQLQRRFEKAGDKQVTAQLSSIDKQVNKLCDLINGLLDLSHVQTGQMVAKREMFAIDSLIKETIANLQRITPTHTISIKQQCRQRIKGDRARIGQVITNLLTNAVKYSPKAKKVVVSSFKEGEEVIVKVEDFGIGIEAGEQERVFERFFRTGTGKKQNFPGLGLGLYLSKEIIEAHGGRIWIEEKKTQGTVFCFGLPLNSTSQKSKTKKLV